MKIVTIPHPNSNAKDICRKTLIAQPFYRGKRNIIERLIDKIIFKRKHFYCERNQRWTSQKRVKGMMKSDGWFWPDNQSMWKIYWPYGIIDGLNE